LLVNEKNFDRDPWGDFLPRFLRPLAMIGRHLRRFKRHLPCPFGPTGSKPVNGPTPRQGQQPTAGRAPGFVIGMGLAPHLCIHIERDFLGGSSVIQNLQDQPMDVGARLIVELGQCRLIPSSHPSDEGSPRLLLGAKSGPH
jgi:hypothetical protein